MELTALVEGLRIAAEQNLLPLEINIDSKEVISMLKVGNLLYDDLLDDCKSRIRRLGRPQVTHCFKEANGVADVMAKLGATTANLKETLIFVVSPVRTRGEIWTDIAETYFERFVNSCVTNTTSDDSSYFVLQPD